MSIAFESELSQFHRFVGERLCVPGASVSPEEALDQWRAEHPEEFEPTETLAALREAIRDMQAGDTGQSLDDFDREFRMRRGLPGAS